MNRKAVLAVILTIAAVAVPATVLALVYGLHTPVETEGPKAVEHFLALAGSMVVGACLALAAGMLLRAAPPLIEVLKLALRDTSKDHAQESV